MLGSVGKNLNNRMEESIGSAADLQQAAEAGLLGAGPPWVCYAYIMEDLPEATQARHPTGKHFPIDPVFKDASYEERMAIYLQRLVAKRFYDAAWFAVGNPKSQIVREPSADLTWAKFEAAIRGRVAYVLA
jgi:Restriction endonuclease XhoI